MYLGQNSKVSLLKNEPDFLRDGHLNVRLGFTSNSAEKGGAIFVADNINDRVICQGATKDINLAECFIPTLRVYTQFANETFINIDTFFTNNTARQSGSEIYGGLLDHCTTSLGAELYIYWSFFNVTWHGFDYIKAIPHKLNRLLTTVDMSHPDYLINNISKSDVMGLISSDGILKFCSDNVISPNHSHPGVLINKGELFTVSVACSS